MPEICFITPCMGRLAHLQQSLPSVASQAHSSSVVVDFSCPQRCGDWVEKTYPAVKVVRAPGHDRWRGSVARNLGAEAADAPWLCFCDADVVLDPRFSAVMLPRLQPGHLFVVRPYQDELAGTFLCNARDFARVGGYDDVIEGWGWEDFDVQDRLRRLLGLMDGVIPSDLARVISHGDDARAENYHIKDISISYGFNKIYSFVKTDWMKLNGRLLEVEERRSLYEAVKRAVGQLRQPGDETVFRLEFRKAAFWRNAPGFDSALAYTIRLPLATPGGGQGPIPPSPQGERGPGPAQG